MQLTNKSANDPCKVNPYHQSGNNCLRNNQCPFRDKPAEMRAVNFGGNEMVSITDQFCSVCRSSLVPCPEPIIEEGKKEQDQPKQWLRWVALASLLLLLGIGIWLINRPKSAPAVATPTTKPDSTVQTKPDTSSSTESVITKPETKRGRSKKARTSLPKVENGFITGIDPRDGRCKEFQYHNSEIIGQRILSPEECNR